MKSFISLDCETNGLYGDVYAVAMIVYRNGVETARFCQSCPIQGEVNSWIKETITTLSTEKRNGKFLHTMSVEGSEAVNYGLMMHNAAEFYKHHACRNDEGEIVEAWGKPNYQTTPILFHCGMIVEGGFFRALHGLRFIGMFDAPMCPIEVGEYLRLRGENPFSVDSYIEKYGIEKSTGNTHNPLFDAEQAAKVYLYLIQK